MEKGLTERSKRDSKVSPHPGLCETTCQLSPTCQRRMRRTRQVRKLSQTKAYQRLVPQPTHGRAGEHIRHRLKQTLGQPTQCCTALRILLLSDSTGNSDFQGCSMHCPCLGVGLRGQAVGAIMDWKAFQVYVPRCILQQLTFPA